MLYLDKIFQKIGNDVVELSLEDWTKNSGLLVQSYQAIFVADSDMKSGSNIELPEGMYDPNRDVLIINQEGFILIPNYQYTESNGNIILSIDIDKDTVIHIIVLKLHNKMQV